MNGEAALLEIAVERCEFCGSTGCHDLRAYPAHFYKQGRRGQGAMTPKWVTPTYSPTLDAVACHACFQKRFYATAAA